MKAETKAKSGSKERATVAKLKGTVEQKAVSSAQIRKVAAGCDDGCGGEDEEVSDGLPYCDEINAIVDKMFKLKPGNQRMAAYLAVEAHVFNMRSHRGTILLYGPLLCLYSNHPYHDPRLREKELRELRSFFAKNKIKEVAFATYPVTGEDAGYTFAMVVETGDVKSVTAEWQRILGDIFDRKS